MKAGDTVYSLANQYGISVYRLMLDNGITENDTLVVGQTLVILFPSVTYVVKAGETLASIAQQFSITKNQLFRNNPQLGANDFITAGQTLIISYEQARVGEMEVNGYAYPFIQPDLMRITMPYMTYFTPFTYGITPTGGLVPLDDSFMIQTAQEFGVKPLMHLSTLTEQGNFSNELASLVLNNIEIQDTLIQNILQNLQQKEYYGLDIDFEFIYPQERDLYTSFIKKLTTTLNAQNYEVVVALAPKTSSTQTGTLYEGHDYGGLGSAANAVLLMTYEWGYTYGPPMAVAPLPNVRAVLNYAVTQIARNRIFLGMPNYGYDWPLPFVQGTTRAQSISNVEAINIARRYRAEIQYDEWAKSPFFQYTNEQGVLHEVWFEDARSMKEKFALVPEYSLRGIGYWNLMRPFPQNWRVLNQLYLIKEIL